ncbi:MAG: transglutaminase family protein, partial [bacterium]
MQDSKTISALLTLLGDEDRYIAQTAEQKLLEIGPAAIPELRSRYEGQPLTTKVRLRDIINQLQPSDLVDDFRCLGSEENQHSLDLEKALFTIAQMGYPQLQTEIYQQRLDSLACSIGEEISRWQVIDEHTVVETVVEIIFRKTGFRGDIKDYYNPQNCFINRVLERKTGSPILLTALVLLVARRLGLPFRAIGMPAHCILSYPRDSEHIFIDPFYGGKILTRQDCYEFLTSAGFGFVDEYLEPITDKELTISSVFRYDNV